MTEVTYPPLDVPKLVADGVWIIDSGPHRIAGVPLPVRMTGLQMADGSLLLHSPTRFTAQTKAALEEIAPIGHLVAPNTVHWSYMAKWQEQVPAATFWAIPGLRKRRAVVAAALRLDRDLPDGPVGGEAEIECILVKGLGIIEAALFHRPSRTLVLTDLIVNVETRKLPWPVSLGARLVGSASPSGRAPFYARMAFKLGGAQAASAANRIVQLEPDRVIFSHGEWFDTNAPHRLREALSWLTS